MKDISYEMLDLMDKYGDSPECIQKILDDSCQPEILTALSPIRENLVDWIDFEQDAHVLEIGSGYGALTGALARKAGELLVLDSRLENLEVNKRRHKGQTNIHYQCGFLEELTGQVFDWVFLIRPEYQSTMDCTEKAMTQEDQKMDYGRQFIRKAAGMVKKGGGLVLAVPNAQAIKILAGCQPDEEMLSMSRQDLKAIFGQLGGESYFYYPLPDDKLPIAIYSDVYLPIKGEIPSLFAEYEKPRYRLFSEEAAYGAICDAGAFPPFANSFLVIWRRG